MSRSYLATGLGRADDDVLTEGDKRRFLQDVKDNFWVKKNDGHVLARIKAELDEIDGISPIKAGRQGIFGEEAEYTEVDEEIEVVEKS